MLQRNLWLLGCLLHLVEVLHEATASEFRRLKPCPFLDLSCHMSFLVCEVVYLARWWQSVAFAISADAYGPADRKSCVSAWDLQVTAACAERSGWSWPTPPCTAHRALQNAYLWELLVSSYWPHPDAGVVEIKLTDKSIAYVSRSFALGMMW